MYRIQQHDKTNKFDSNFGVDQLKQELINFIFRSIDLSHYKFSELEVESELAQLSSRKYFVSANFIGSNCLLVFTKIRDKYETCLIDRRTLSYNPNKIDLKTVKITNVKVKLDLDIYKGTIFDGTFIVNKNTKTFVITDVYMFKGDRLIKSQLDSKLLTVMTYLKSNYNDNDKDNDLKITMNRLFSLDETEHLVNDIIPKIKDCQVRGLCFYPDTSGIKLLYAFGNETKKTDKPMQQYEQKATYSSHPKDDSSPDGQQLIIPKAPEIKKSVKIAYVPKNEKDDESYVFAMEKTDTVDVYKLIAIERVKKGEDKKQKLKKRKIGLAFVPNKTRSKWCSETMEKSGGEVLVHCKYHEDNSKWEPFLISTSKRPSFIDDFDTKQLDE